MRPRVQACLNASSIRVEGHVVVRIEVDPSGEITRSGTDHVDGLDPEVVFCVVRAVRACRMPEAQGPSQVRIGLDFADPREVLGTAQPEVELADVPLEPVEARDATTDDDAPPPDDEEDEPPPPGGFDRDN